MDALAILFALVFWVVLSGVMVVKCTRLLSPFCASWHLRTGIGGLLALVMLLIPTADDLLGRYRVKRLCEKEGGVRIFKTVENVEGIQMNSADEVILRATKYQYVESTSTKAGGSYRIPPARYSLTPSGRVIVEKNIIPRARYEYQRREEVRTDHISRYDQLIVDLQTNQILATDTYFGFRGGWAARTLLGWGGGGGAGCGYAHISESQFMNSVLKPIK